MSAQDKILVIKLGALGDVVQALGPMAAIRAFHKDARIDLLTTAPFVEFLTASGYADRVIPHRRLRWTELGAIAAFRNQLRQAGYTRVYDLQTSDRTSFYHRLFWPGPRPEWSGIAPGCSHPHANPARDRMHTIERQREQLAMAGITDVPAPDLGWATADLGRYDLPERYMVMVPGGALHRPEKWWPAGRFSHLAKRLARMHITPVLVGADNERELHNAITTATPAARSLVGETSLVELAAVCRGAELVVGNDTGPMHVAAVTGAPTIVLYSHASDPALCGQRGPKVTILRKEKLPDISVEDVLEAAQLAPTGA